VDSAEFINEIPHKLQAILVINKMFPASTRPLL